jgi:hypothetical protein
MGAGLGDVRSYRAPSPLNLTFSLMEKEQKDQIACKLISPAKSHHPTPVNVPSALNPESNTASGTSPRPNTNRRLELPISQTSMFIANRKLMTTAAAPAVNVNNIANLTTILARQAS